MPHWPFRIALIGAGSPLAAAVREGLVRTGFAVECFDWQAAAQASLMAAPTAWALLPANPREAAALAGVLGTLQPAEAPALVLALSSYRVFSGEKSGFYHEADLPDAADAGAQHWHAIERWAASFPAHCLLRTDRLFGPEGDNIFTRLLTGVIDTGEVQVTGHLRGCPTAEEDLARVITGMLQQMGSGAQCWGAFHYCSGDVTPCSEFAEAVITHARQFQALPDVTLITHDSEASGQRSPLLSCQRLLDNFGIRQRSWRSSLPGIVRGYFAKGLSSPSNPRPAH